MFGICLCSVLLKKDRALPTGFGKSILFQFLPDFLPTKVPTNIVVSAFNSIIEDRMKAPSLAQSYHQLPITMIILLSPSYHHDHMLWRTISPVYILVTFRGSQWRLRIWEQLYQKCLNLLWMVKWNYILSFRNHSEWNRKGAELMTKNQNISEKSTKLRCGWDSLMC